MPRITPTPHGKNVIELGPHCKMSPEEVLALASRYQWETVLIVGYYQGGEFATLSSRMTRETANWLIDHCKLHVMDRL